MLDKVVISWTHCLCSPHPAAMLLWLPLSRLWLAASPLSYPPPCAHGPAIRMGLFLPGLPCSRRHQLQVAEIFGKRHYDVMQDISRILSRLSASFMARNFSRYETEYKVGFGMKKISAYLLSKDGFPYAGETFLPAHPAR